MQDVRSKSTEQTNDLRQDSSDLGLGRNMVTFDFLLIEAYTALLIRWRTSTIRTIDTLVGTSVPF